MTRAFLATIMLTAAVHAFSHAVEGEISMTADVRVRVTYDDGAPLKIKPFWVLDASNAVIASGSTDADGVLRFTPLQDREQILIVKDRLGHRLREKFDPPRLAALMAESGLSAGAKTGSGQDGRSAGPGRGRDILGGLGYLLGITGLGAYYLARKEKAAAHAP